MALDFSLLKSLGLQSWVSPLCQTSFSPTNDDKCCRLKPQSYNFQCCFWAHDRLAGLCSATFSYSSYSCFVSSTHFLRCSSCRS